MNGESKENANPKIIEVIKRPSKLHPSSRIWSSINTIPHDGGQLSRHDFSYSYSINRSIFNALQQSSDATQGRFVSLLQSSGLVLRQGECATSDKSIHPFPIHFSNFATNVTVGSSQPELDRQQMRREMFNEDEVFDIIRNIQDPEHPLTLEQLGVVTRQQIEVKENQGSEGYSTIDVRFTPTIPHCSMATLIGLSVRVKLLRSLPSNDRFKVTVRIEPGTHNSELAVNKQLADKERVCAALENKHLLGLVNKCISSGMRLSI
jgi:metal-sulfur cluster biosynthetic enzyme